ncbi:MAG: tetratricopeptide repeat protein [Promethearchaeota archaeon]|nr:MAG: tetratricopeptide repeat protein [Candidatus Lokiarchaeota archaeon]
MSLNELIKAKELFECGNFEDVLLLLKKVENREDLINRDKLTLNLLKSSAYYRFREDPKCLEYAQKAYKLSKNLGLKLNSIDALLNIAWASLWLGNFEKAFESVLKSENIYKSLKDYDEIDVLSRKAAILFIKSCACWFTAKMDGLKFAEESLKLRQKIGKKYEIVESYSMLCGFSTYFQEDLDYTLKLLEKCQNLAIEINHPWMNSFNPKNFGDIYYIKGDLEKALSYYKKAIKPFEETNNSFPMITTLGEIGNTYREMGKINQCLIQLRKSYKIAVKTENNWIKSEVIADLIEIIIINNEVKEAQRYLKELEIISRQETDNRRIKQSYLISKALILKSSPRFNNLVKAQQTLKLIIDNGSIKNESFIIALLNQCEILLRELNITHNIQIIDEIRDHIEKLLKITKKLRSYWILAETYVLQAKLALLTFNLKGARKLLTKAQKIAEEYGMYRLAAKISYQHDDLLRKLKIWKNLRDSKSSLTERFTLTNINKQMTYMIQKRRIEAPPIIEEQPIIILITSQDGNVIFTHYFNQKTQFNSDLFAGFISTINIFMKEVFSEELDRAMFGNYTLLMKYLQPFYITYVFNGDSYYAHQRIKYFTESLKKQEIIWEKLLTNCEKGKSVHINDIPSLESLISNIFVYKNVELDQLL